MRAAASGGRRTAPRADIRTLLLARPPAGQPASGGALRACAMRAHCVRALLTADAQGCREPTAVQMQVLPLAMSGRDVRAVPRRARSCARSHCAKQMVIVAPTGSGKTAAYLLPLLARLHEFQRASTSDVTVARRPLALVVAPTRELCLQIEAQAKVGLRWCRVHVHAWRWLTHPRAGVLPGPPQHAYCCCDWWSPAAAAAAPPELGRAGGGGDPRPADGAAGEGESSAARRRVSHALTGGGSRSTPRCHWPGCESACWTRQTRCLGSRRVVPAGRASRAGGSVSRC